jgi:hypothetical protein
MSTYGFIGDLLIRQPKRRRFAHITHSGDMA